MKINIQKIEDRRQRKSIGKQEFSVMIGLTVTSYGKIIKHESTTLKRLNAIAEALGVAPKSLLE